MGHGKSRTLFALGTVLLSVALGAACRGAASYSLVERFENAETSFEDGQFPSFVEASASGTIELSGDARAALTPPFPARIRYEIRLPEAAFLEVAPAVVMSQLVRRARIRFSVSLVRDGVNETVYTDIFRLNQANEWHDLRVDLTRWAGQSVSLVLETQAVPQRQRPLWADRVQTAWGEPRIISSRMTAFASAARRVGASASEWLVTAAAAAGLLPEDVQRGFQLALNMILGGLLSTLIQALYKAFGTSSSNREDFARTFPVFALVTILVITVVRHSLALSLGLIGALSIVRFRSAVKNPEDIIYLLFNVAIGVALGANQRLLAISATVVISLFVLLRQVANRPAYEHNLLLTLAGQADEFFSDNHPSAVEQLRSLAGPLILQRLDEDEGRIELRAILTLDDATKAEGLLERLHDRFPRLELTFVDLETLN